MQIASANIPYFLKSESNLPVPAQTRTLITESYTLCGPQQSSCPFLFSSPHSGAEYPPEFLARSPLDSLMIRSSEDAFVDRLFEKAPILGAPLLSARLPRAFIDLNRSAEELDPAVIEGLERVPHNPRISSGLGVIPRVVSGGRLIYRGKLSQREAAERISRYWQPWHHALQELITGTRAALGSAVVIDCHSMPHEAIEASPGSGSTRPQIVLGDRYGAAAGPAVMEQVEAAFSAAGLRVSRNTPFAGAYITQAYGRPAHNIHVIQVEIDRALYMDEKTITPHAGFEDFAALITGVIAKLTGAELNASLTAPDKKNPPLAAE